MPKVDTNGAREAVPKLSGWVPNWPVPAHVHAFMSTRAGGVSAPPFDSLNLGSHVQDDPAAVAHNRLLLASNLRSRPVFLNQVHGNVCVDLHADTPDGTLADACFTQALGVACTVMVADCLPVLLADTSGRAVAAAHAGWRGLAGVAGDGGVLAQAIKLFQALAHDLIGSGAMYSATLIDARRADTNPDATPQRMPDVVAWLGPCIGPTAFEVGEDVRDAFTAQPSSLPGAAGCFSAVVGKPGKHLCDLARLARLQLAALGVTRVYGNDGSPPWCTVSQAATWFSHRRDAGPLGSSGRMAACVWLG